MADQLETTQSEETATNIEPENQTTETSSNSSSVVRNPEKLLELFNEQKQQLKELKEYQAKTEKEKNESEQARLKREQQYEALIPLKVEEAIKPLQSQLSKYEKDKVTLEQKLAAKQKEYDDLVSSLKLEKTKDSLYSEFIANSGDPKVSKDALWKLYGDQVQTTDDGKIEGVNDLLKSLQSDEIGKKFFIVNTPSGTGTPQQTKTSVPSAKSDAPRVVTKAMLLNPRKNGFTMDDVIKGKVVVEE